MNPKPTAQPPSATRTILLTGFVAGTLDALAASISFFLRRNDNPIKVWRFVASGVFGKEANADPDSLLMPALGLFFHFCLAFAFTIFFFFIFPKIKLLAKNFFITGVVYGLLVWLVMNKVVLPLSNTAKLPPRPGPSFLGIAAQTWLGIAFIVFCIGLPIAYFTSRYYRDKDVFFTGAQLQPASN